MSNQLSTLNSNTYFASDKGQPGQKIHEIIFITKTPVYKGLSDGGVVRDYELNDVRVTVPDSGIDTLISFLQALKAGTIQQWHDEQQAETR